jgi:hypothetical protein
MISAMDALYRNGNRFIVAARSTSLFKPPTGFSLTTATPLPSLLQLESIIDLIPEQFRQMFLAIPASELHIDLSSSMLRASLSAAAAATSEK